MKLINFKFIQENNFLTKGLLSILLCFILINASPSLAAWTAGANVITENKEWSNNLKFDLGECGEQPWYWDVRLFFKKVRLFELNLHGGWDAGYDAYVYYNFGEGVDITGSNNPQLITKADAGLGAKAWIKAEGPGVRIDLWGADPFDINVLDVIGMSNTLLDEEFEIPSIQSTLPFLDDNKPLLSIPFGNNGIYANDYSKRTELDVVKLFAKIPGIKTLAEGNIGFARGFKGKVEFGLGSIDYYQDSNHVVGLGSQTHASSGVDVSGFTGQTLHINKRTYNFDVKPSVTVGIAAFVDINIIGFSYNSYFPKQNVTEPALANIDISTQLEGLNVTLNATGDYEVPAPDTTSPPENTSPFTISPKPITPSTVPSTGGEQTFDTRPPVSSVQTSLINSMTAWPRKITITAMDDHDNAPVIYYSFNNEFLTCDDYRGCGPKTIVITLDRETTVNFFAVDATKNTETKKSLQVRALKVLMGDQNLFDHTMLEAGKTYTKKWWIKNIGTSTLTGLEAVQTYGNHKLGVLPTTISIPSLSVDETRYISCTFTVPNNVAPGTERHFQYWRLHAENGVPVQVGAETNSEFWLDLLTEGPPEDPTKFIDVPSSADLASVVYDYGVAKGIINPPSSQNHWRFNPFNDITRAEFLKILINSLGVSFDTTGTTFTDVPPSHPLFMFVQTAKNSGWTKGYGDGTFGPEDTLLHYQMAIFLHVASGWGNSALSGGLYNDVPASPPSGSEYADIWEIIYQAVKSLKDRGVFLEADEDFGLDKPLKRANMLYLVKKFVETLAENPPSNHAPTGLTVNGITDTVHSGEVFNITATATDLEQDTLTYQFLSTGGVFSEQSGGSISWTAPDVSSAISITFTISVSDGNEGIAKKTYGTTVYPEGIEPPASPDTNDLNTSPTYPSAQLSTLYDKEEDKFYLNYSVNENTDAMKIYYSFDNVNWDIIFQLNVSIVKKGNQPEPIDDAENYNVVWFKIEATNSSTGEIFVSDVIAQNYEPKPPYIEKGTEFPDIPVLYGLGTETSRDHVTLRWKKVIDSHYNDNVTYYEVQYADNRSFDNATLENVGNTAAGNNTYESISYIVTGLQDNKSYYFRVRATNNLGTSNWSAWESIHINIQDNPYFDEDYQIPANRATNISKTPILEWRAYDDDVDELDYYVTYGTSADNLYTKRSFRKAGYEGQNWFDFAAEHHEPLKPNTKYFWQIWVREDGRDNDYYGGEYIKSPVWNFTTIGTGSDMAMIGATHEGEISPDSEALFKVTVENQGTEIAAARSIKCFYIKNGQECEFWTGYGRVDRDLAHGEQAIVDVTVQFRDEIWISQSGQEYDNVLVSGESQIRFEFASEDVQDINDQNNSILNTINYVDAGGPVVDYFDLRECGRLSLDWFWARMGQDLVIVVGAHDDIQISRGVVDLRYDSTLDNWITIYEGTNNSDDMHFYSDYCIECADCGGNFVSWHIPVDINATDNAQVRVRLYDDQGNMIERISEPFSIVSNRIEATIEQASPVYDVGKPMQFNINFDSDNDIQLIEVDLIYGARRDSIFTQFNENGIANPNTLQWNIPDNNSYASQNCYLRCRLDDVFANSVTITSDKFQIKENTELPSPFNESIILYSDEFAFPSGSLYTTQDREIKFVKLDNNNIVHTVVSHMYRYYKDTDSGDNEDFLEYVNKKYYITYNPSTNVISSKIEICDNNYDVVDFSIYNETPYVLLKSAEFETIYYSYKSGASFTAPVAIENINAPSINGYPSLIDSETDSSAHLSDFGKHILHDGYLWDLDIFTNKIYRHSFNNGYIGNREYLSITNNAGTVTSNYIKPVSEGNYIYYVDPIYGKKLVKIDTASAIAESYSLPYDPETSSDSRYKTAMVHDNGKLFIFGNGRIYALEGNSVVEKGNITYTFNGQLFDITSKWDNIKYAKTIKTENKVYVIFRFNSPCYTSIPTVTEYEMLEFNSTTCTFTKSIARFSGSLGNLDWHEAGAHISGNCDMLYLGNNKVLSVFATDFSRSSSLKNYFAALQLLDLETGAVSFLGQLPLKSEGAVSLHENNGDIYVLAKNEGTGKTESYSISLANIDNNVKQIESPRLIQHNSNLYAEWAYGNYFDGTWNNAENTLNDYIHRRNKFCRIAPFNADVKDMYGEFLGRNITCSENYISTDYGFVAALNSDFTVSDIIYENSSYDCPLSFKTLGTSYISALERYAGDFDEILLIKPDLTTDVVNIFSGSNLVAAFDNEIVTIGNGRGEYSSKQCITKHDITTGESTAVAFGYSSNNFDRVDVNVNQYVAVSWANYLAVADYSGDIVEPVVHFTNDQTEAEAGSTINLSWQASDNRDELIRYELYKIEDGKSSLFATINDVSITGYAYTLNDESAVTFKVLAYDLDGNIGFDSIDLTIFSPIEFTNFSVNKSIVQLGGKLIFSWNVTGAENDTTFTILKRKLGSVEWEEYIWITGRYDESVTVEGFVGEYEFRIAAGDYTRNLEHSVSIEGDIIVFNDSVFTPTVNGYYGDNHEIELHWVIEATEPDLASYRVYIKLDDETEFSHAATTSLNYYQYSIPENVVTLAWKVVAEYKGATYESQVKTVQISALASPDITALTVVDNHTDSPCVKIEFDNIFDINEYLIVRKDDSGNTVELGITAQTPYIDSAVSYGHEYEYRIKSKSGNTLGADGGARLVFIDIKPVTQLSFKNENYGVLESNSLTLSYEPAGENLYEKYEILIGTNPQVMTQLQITQGRSVDIDDLAYNTTYYAHIYILDYEDKRISNKPFQLVFTTSADTDPITEKPLITYITNALDQIVLSWSDVPHAEKYHIFRSKNGEEHRFIGTTKETNFLDYEDVQRGYTYSYLVKATNINSYILSNEIFAEIEVELSDAINALQILTNTASSKQIVNIADVNNDGKIGIEEVIFIFQKIAGSRP